MPNEADTCWKFVVPRLQAAGWEPEPHRLNEQVIITDGRIIAAGSKGHRRPGKRADYLLPYCPDLSIAVVEAKASYYYLNTMRQLQARTAADLDAMLPAVLDGAFRGEL